MYPYVRMYIYLIEAFFIEGLTSMICGVHSATEKMLYKILDRTEAIRQGVHELERKVRIDKSLTKLESKKS